MIDSKVRIPIKSTPVLLDKVLQDLQVALSKNLLWLNHAFGRAQRLVEHRLDDNKFIYPAIYLGSTEYLSMLPNDQLGNFSWFDIYDPQEITEVVQSKPQYTFSGAIVFWYNLRSIYPDDSVLYTEEIKDEVLTLLTTPGILTTNSRIAITKVFERFENIYKGYSLEKVYNTFVYSGQGIQELDKQFFMYPYAGLRVEFTITTRELCQRYIK